MPVAATSLVARCPRLPSLAGLAFPSDWRLSDVGPVSSLWISALGLGAEAEGWERPVVMGLTCLVVKRRGDVRPVRTFGGLTIQSTDNEQLLRCFSVSLAPSLPFHCSPATMPREESRNEI